MRKLADPIRDMGAVTCTTPEDFNALARYDRIMRSHRAGFVALLGKAFVEAAEAREAEAQAQAHVS